MSWNYNTSLNRVETHLEGMGEIEVEKLVRDADLHNLLSETCCRDIYGAHVYLDIPNFADLATMTTEGEDCRHTSPNAGRKSSEASLLLPVLGLLAKPQAAASPPQAPVAAAGRRHPVSPRSVAVSRSS